ncbi:hypothetical protein A3B45_04180 [Candidatus Daviesbacteria bacterium RIFCSPLOWO2_01_FULL_39_12]|uniref:Phosphatidic acid phosphatase type 2/haloperoxidase domain-containing protein n=1 Tax=Candidatus Daviesbacteria bacterium RIFCSPLOWO2_01_FULL_39_12 TaxID=1797785 RepID=A0A1F5KT64_9BACT|nr:MAG: hypothetical protein A3B45_04180 [Candidatus Daviesbacteria bacterium RIFCSPLOWO2_01_FULL_39_12]
MRKLLLFLSILTILAFTYLSYTVAKERWQSLDFDTMVKIQDHIPRKFDQLFSYATLLGDWEVTLTFCVLMSALMLLRKRFWAFLGWLIIIPATIAEVFGKLVLFHPSPSVFFYRTILPSSLPQFYVHTNFSYPSGHMTRTIFIITIIFILVLFSKQSYFLKFVEITLLIFLALTLALTRIYLGEHWLSDVLGGLLLGFGMGLFASVLILPKRLS